jgi:hypothetical protein
VGLDVRLSYVKLIENIWLQFGSLDDILSSLGRACVFGGAHLEGYFAVPIRGVADGSFTAGF